MPINEPCMRCGLFGGQHRSRCPEATVTSPTTPEPRNELDGIPKHEYRPGWHRYTDGQGGGYTEPCQTIPPEAHLEPSQASKQTGIYVTADNQPLLIVAAEHAWHSRDAEVAQLNEMLRIKIEVSQTWVKKQKDALKASQATLARLVSFLEGAISGMRYGGAPDISEYEAAIAAAKGETDGTKD